MTFTKMHGLGNDYIYIDGFTHNVADPSKLARQLADRHVGVGSDGLILILPSDKADVRMRMFNADGSESQMCGNGVRCVAKYAFDHGLTTNNPMTVETDAGVLTLSMELEKGKVSLVTVNMGQPILNLMQIPVDPVEVAPVSDHVYRIHLGSRMPEQEAVFVSMGNPHAVIFVDDVEAVDVQRLGELVERHPAFPQRINAHWAQVNSASDVTMRTWERGTGITQACGTGACAVAVAGVLTEKTGRRITAHLPGGDLKLEWAESDNTVYMTGPATEVFRGELSIEV